MSPYIINLTNNIIGNHRFDEAVKRLLSRQDENSHPDVILDHITTELEVAEIHEMKPETLGKILFSLEIGDVMATNPFREVSFGGDCEEAFRQLVSRCLAYVIRDRLNPRMDESHIPPYRR